MALNNLLKNKAKELAEQGLTSLKNAKKLSPSPKNPSSSIDDFTNDNLESVKLKYPVRSIKANDYFDGRGYSVIPEKIKRSRITKSSKSEEASEVTSSETASSPEQSVAPRITETTHSTGGIGKQTRVASAEERAAADDYAELMGESQIPESAPSSGQPVTPKSQIRTSESSSPGGQVEEYNGALPASPMVGPEAEARYKNFKYRNGKLEQESDSGVFLVEGTSRVPAAPRATENPNAASPGENVTRGENAQATSQSGGGSNRGLQSGGKFNARIAAVEKGRANDQMRERLTSEFKNFGVDIDAAKDDAEKLEKIARDYGIDNYKKGMTTNELKGLGDEAFARRVGEGPNFKDYFNGYHGPGLTAAGIGGATLLGIMNSKGQMSNSQLYSDPFR